MFDYKKELKDQPYKTKSIFLNFYILAKENNKTAIVATPFFFYFAFCSLIMTSIALSDTVYLTFHNNIFTFVSLLAAAFSLVSTCLIFGFYNARFKTIYSEEDREEQIEKVNLFSYEMFAICMICLSVILDRYVTLFA